MGRQVGCCEASDSEEDSLLDPLSYRRSDRGQSPTPLRGRQSSREAILHGDPRDQTALKNSVLDGVYAGLTGSIGLTPVENPFSPQQVCLRSVGTYSVSLPRNIHSAAICAILNLGADQCMLLWARDIPVILCSLLSLTLQCGFAFSIAWTQFDEAVELGTCALGGRFIVRISCIMVFTMHMIGELGELLDTHFWLSLFLYSHKHTPLQIREYQDRVGRTVNKPVTGITYLERFVLYLLFLLPRLVFIIVLLLMGIPYIAFTKRNEDLLLNTVALWFVAEVDEIVYKFVIPKMYRDTLDLPPLGRSEEERSRCFEMVVCGTIRSYMAFFFLTIVSTLLYFFWCQN